VIDLDLQYKQSVALTTDATEILYGGAAGGGKSHLMRVAAIYWCCHIPSLQVYIFRRKFPDLWKNHMEGPTAFPAMLSEFVLKGWVSINNTKNYIQFWNGSKIMLCHCQHEKDVYDYQGAEIHVLMVDELTTFTEYVYRYLRGRVRLGGLQVPEEYKGMFPRILGSANPGGIGHNWVKQTFIDVQPPLAIARMNKKEGGMLRQFIPALLEDNPALTDNDPDYEDRLEGLGNEALVEAMRHGDWDIVAGGMFDDVWQRDRHVIKPFQIPSSWRIDRSFDWGSSKPFSVGWWAESDGTNATMQDGTVRSFPRGTLFRIAEWYGWNGKANEGSKMLAREIAEGIVLRENAMGIYYRVEPGPADSSIFSREDGHCIADEMLVYNVMWEPANKAPGTRKQGWELMRRAMKATLRSPMEDPGLIIFENCVQFIRTVPTLTRLDRDLDDIDTNAEDHIADEVRYRLLQTYHEEGTVQITGW
jgi:hypothetical protein